MTDTPVEEMPVQEETPQEPQAEPEPEPVTGNCRWCGAAHEQMPDESDDWLCDECSRYQDAMTCPTCGGLARVSALPASMVPAPAAKKG
jgi:hypothetical protein